MLFTSLEFLFGFLPVTLLVYFLLPTVGRNYWLLLVSLFFYAWGEPKFLIVMLVSIGFNYLIALRIAELGEDPPKALLRKVMLGVAVAANIGLLFVYKYLNFVIASINTAAGGPEPVFKQTEFVLPIGISFFTFQALSYVIDVYRGVKVQKNPAFVGLYIALFPQLIAGPIVRYTTVEEQILHREVTADLFAKGIRRFLYGFNKKMLLANVLAITADAAFASAELSVGMAWLGCICYTLQIFFDFCGYSEMAIGLGMMFGFRFLENFNYPYISKTITEFWRRWHISLGSWFRDYIYFPLGGSRVKSRWRLVFNLSVVWLATGIWHGANWTFLLWGALFGVIIIVEKLFGLPQKLTEHRAAGAVYQIFALLAVMLGWVLFRAENLTAALTYIKSMFALNGNLFWDDMFQFHLREYMVILAAGILCSTPLIRWGKEKLSAFHVRVGQACEVTGIAVQFALFLVGISYLVMNAHNPFIYFNF